MSSGSSGNVLFGSAQIEASALVSLFVNVASCSTPCQSASTHTRTLAHAMIKYSAHTKRQPPPPPPCHTHASHLGLLHVHTPRSSTCTHIERTPQSIPTCTRTTSGIVASVHAIATQRARGVSAACCQHVFFLRPSARSLTSTPPTLCPPALK